MTVGLTTKKGGKKHLSFLGRRRGKVPPKQKPFHFGTFFPPLARWFAVLIYQTMKPTDRHIVNTLHGLLNGLHAKPGIPAPDPPPHLQPLLTVSSTPLIAAGFVLQECVLVVGVGELCQEGRVFGLRAFSLCGSGLFRDTTQWDPTETPTYFLSDFGNELKIMSQERNVVSLVHLPSRPYWDWNILETTDWIERPM